MITNESFLSPSPGHGNSALNGYASGANDSAAHGAYIGAVATEHASLSSSIMTMLPIQRMPRLPMMVVPMLPIEVMPRVAALVMPMLPTIVV